MRSSCTLIAFTDGTEVKKEAMLRLVVRIGRCVEGEADEPDSSFRWRVARTLVGTGPARDRPDCGGSWPDDSPSGSHAALLHPALRGGEQQRVPAPAAGQHAG